MAFDYDRETKNHYKDDFVAEKYHNAFAQDKGLKAFRFRVVAKRERTIIGRFLRQVPHQKVLDIPAGTGKLASILKNENSSIKACDISENMLSIARQVYKEIQYNRVEFQVCDAQKIRETIDDHFDLAICLRLLQRVPGEVKIDILEELASIADYSIVSFGIHSFYHKWRRAIRNMLFKDSTKVAGCEPLKAVIDKIEKNFEIIDCKWVLPWLSMEIIFLLRPKRK